MDKKYIAKHKITGKEFDDYQNKNGCLLRYIKEVNSDIDIPSKFLRKKYYNEYGVFWYEQFFDIIEICVDDSKKTNLDIDEIIKLYVSGNNRNIHKLAKKYNVGHKKISKILKDNNVEVNKRGGVEKYKNLGNKYIINDDNTIYIAKHKITGKEFCDYKNKSGILSKYIEIHDKAIIPKLESEKKTYILNNGCNWYERYFDILLVDKSTLNNRRCPYCSIDIDTSISNTKYKNHLIKTHKIDIKKHIEIYIEDMEMFKNEICEIDKNNDLNNWVTCKICGEDLQIINSFHLKKHNLTVKQYKEKYGNNTSINFLNDTTKRLKSYNLDGRTISYKSKKEKEIKSYLESIGVECTTNRQILIGREIDMLSDEHKIGIEFNGNKWHTEWFGGKDKNYHLGKTIKCNDNGYGLIHIFEDEWVCKNEIVKYKLKHIFNKNINTIKIGARKTNIRLINKNISCDFLNKYHIQGDGQSSISIGSYYKDDLVAVMTFKKLNNETNDYDLTRFATNFNYNISGVASKLLSYFIKLYKPESIISFADRRWTLDKDDNLYTKLGFNLVKVLQPDYKYYNEKVDRYTRFHKFNFRKQIINKKYGLPLSMTETEMVKNIGYDRIWDCGLFKYEWKNKKED